MGDVDGLAGELVGDQGGKELPQAVGEHRFGAGQQRFQVPPAVAAERGGFEHLEAGRARGNPIVGCHSVKDLVAAGCDGLKLLIGKPSVRKAMGVSLND